MQSNDIMTAYSMSGVSSIVVESICKVLVVTGAAAPTFEAVSLAEKSACNMQVYQYCIYTNYNSTLLSQINPEIIADA